MKKNDVADEWKIIKVMVLLLVILIPIVTLIALNEKECPKLISFSKKCYYEKLQQQKEEVEVIFKLEDVNTDKITPAIVSLKNLETNTEKYYIIHNDFFFPRTSLSIEKGEYEIRFFPFINLNNNAIINPTTKIIYKDFRGSERKNIIGFGYTPAEYFEKKDLENLLQILNSDESNFYYEFDENLRNKRIESIKQIQTIINYYDKNPRNFNKLK